MKFFSGSSPGHLAVLQLPCCPCRQRGTFRKRTTKPSAQVDTLDCTPLHVEAHAFFIRMIFFCDNVTIRPHRQLSSSRTGSSPTCKFVNCGAPEVPENAEVGLQNNGTYYGSVAFYKCNDHFKLDGKTRTHAFASASRFEWQI